VPNGEVIANVSQAPAGTEVSISFSKLQASPPLVLSAIGDSSAAQGAERSTTASASLLRAARAATPIILRVMEGSSRIRVQTARTFYLGRERCAKFLIFANLRVKRAGDLVPVIRSIQASGASVRHVAAELTRRGITAARGGRWSAVQVRRVLERV
jgi:hypothetical protein